MTALLSAEEHRAKLVAFFAKKHRFNRKKKHVGGEGLEAERALQLQQQSMASALSAAAAASSTDEVDTDNANGASAMQQEGWIEVDNERRQVIQTAGKTLTSIEYV